MGSDVHCRRLRLLGDVKYVNANMRRDKDFMLKCKILLPKFNTWKQGQIERKKGSLSPFDNATDRIFAKNFCDYGVMASPLHCNGIAITP